MKLIHKTDKSTESLNDLHKMRRLDIGNDLFLNGNFHQNLAILKLDTLNAEHLAMLKESISSLLNKNVEVSKIIHTYKRIRLGSDIITSSSYRAGSSPDMFVHAVHLSSNIGELRPALVRKIFDIVAIFQEDNAHIRKSFKYAYVDWFQNHQFKDHYGELCPMKLWSTLFECTEVCNFIPINFI